MSKGKSLMKRRIIAITAVAVLAVALLLSWFFLRDVIKTKHFEDVDGKVYSIVYDRKTDTYTMRNEQKNVLPTEEEYGCYVTAAGTLVSLDAATGETEVKAVVDTEYSEVEGFNSRLLMFPHTEKKNILDITVTNEYGTYEFGRYVYNSDKGEVELKAGEDFIIKGCEFGIINQELFASLYVSCGYTLTTMKVENPIKDAAGEFSEYGLVPETRTDEEGNPYDYEPAYYVLTDASFKKHKVLVGDRLVTGGGYYVQYVEIGEDNSETKRDAVYVLSADIAESILAPIEDFVTPTVIYPMTMNNYFNVENFTVWKGDDIVTCFSYKDLTLREDTIESNRPYNFVNVPGKGYAMDGYTPNDNTINSLLMSLYDTKYLRTVKVMPTEEDFLTYGLGKLVDDPENPGEQIFDMSTPYMYTFRYNVPKTSEAEAFSLVEIMYISEKNEEGNYYVYGFISDENGLNGYSYDIIAEVEGYCFDYLTYTADKWVDSGIFALNIFYCQEISLESPELNVKFILDNSLTDTSASAQSTTAMVVKTEKGGETSETFGSMTFTDQKGNVWTVTSTDVTAVSSTGGSLKIKIAEYDYNKMDRQVRILNEKVLTADGYFEVYANEVVVVKDGVRTVYNRYGTNLFRQFYQTLLYATLEGAYEMTEAEETALLNDPDKHMLTFTVTNTLGETKTVSFYRLTARKAYVTVNGVGGFYMLPDRVNKIISDAQRFMNNELITPTDKY